MVQACWRALQPALAKVPIVTAGVLARLATPPRAEPPPPSGGSWASAQWAPLAPERAIAVAAA